MQKTIEFLVTATSDTIEVGGNEILTFGMQGTGATDQVATAQAQLVDNGNWYDLQVMADSILYSTVSGVRAIRFVVSSMGATTKVEVDVTGADV